MKELTSRFSNLYYGWLLGMRKISKRVNDACWHRPLVFSVSLLAIGIIFPLQSYALKITPIFTDNDNYTHSRLLTSDGMPATVVKLTPAQQETVKQALRNIEQVITSDIEIILEVYAVNSGGFSGFAEASTITFQSPEGNPSAAYDMLRAHLVTNNPHLDRVIPSYQEFSAARKPEAGLPQNHNWKPPAITVSRAQAKALNLPVATFPGQVNHYAAALVADQLAGVADGAFVMVTALDPQTWDLNPNDGIGLNLTMQSWEGIRADIPSTFPAGWEAYDRGNGEFEINVRDFVGVTMHEVLHAIGFYGDMTGSNTSTIDAEAGLVVGGDQSTSGIHYDHLATANQFGINPFDMLRVKESQVLKQNGVPIIKSLTELRKLQRYLIAATPYQLVTKRESYLDRNGNKASRKVYSEEKITDPINNVSHLIVTDVVNGKPVYYNMSPDWNNIDLYHFRTVEGWIYDTSFNPIGYQYNYAKYPAPGPYNESGMPLYGQQTRLMGTTASRHFTNIITDDDAVLLKALGYQVNPEGVRCQNQFLPPVGEPCDPN